MCWMHGATKPCRVCYRLERTAVDPFKHIHAKLTDNPYLGGFNTSVALPETSRCATNFYVRNIIFSLKKSEADDEAKRKTAPRQFAITSDSLWARLKRRKVSSAEAVNRAELELAGVRIKRDIPIAHTRLYRFLAVLDILRSAHWSCIRFDPNEDMLRRMTATHLELIVGEKECAAHKTDLLNIISTKLNLSMLMHIVWITNRQNGKTTTLSRFLAAMAMMSIAGGPLIYVYSTNRDRAIELIDGSKRYINEVRTNPDMKIKLAQIGVEIPAYESNNNIGFSIRSAVNPGAINIIKARPKTADSCRGDAPKACLFDEVGFVTGAFWFQFAFPLVQVGARIFTMATTPAHSGTFFAEFTNDVLKAMGHGNYMFYLINHNIECEACKEADVECYHKMYNVPSWKPITGFHKAKDLVPEKHSADFKKEFRGSIAEENNRYFPPKWVNHFFDVKNSKPFDNVSHRQLDVFIGVDPPSHAVSFMGLSAIVYNGEHIIKSSIDITKTGGLVYLVGQAEVGVKDSQLLELSRLVISFTLKVLEQLITLSRPAKHIRVMPIVECNNNEFLANTLMQRIVDTATLRGAKHYMPFKKPHFTKEVKEFVGVWTTNVTKNAGIQLLNNMMQDKRVWVWRECVTIGSVYLKRNVEPTTTHAIKVLRESLVQFQSTEKGPSGKTANTNDDGAMAFMLALYFSWRVRSIVLFSDK